VVIEEAVIAIAVDMYGRVFCTTTTTTTTTL